MYGIDLRQVKLIICRLVVGITNSLDKHFAVASLDTMNIDVACMQSFVFIGSPSTTKSLHIVLKLGLHDATNYDNVTADAGVN